MVFETVIPRSVRVAEAPSDGLPVTEHAPSSPASFAYRALAEELVARG
jgi:chromosome partitioning protein